ncbi:MAG: MMPL family transporter [Oscillospiraceae bacterium]|nr:MMPL family transporter [Oscillospiraceae bacterium]
MALVCFALYFFVGVNYNLVDYLPPNEQSTRAIAIMGEEFTQKIPNANVMIRDVSIFGALDYKRLLSEIDGVTDVVWLDDFADLKVPIGMQDASLVEMYYKDGAALFMLSIESGMETRACAAIRELIYTEDDSGGNALSGEAADRDFMQSAALSEVLNAMAIILPISVAILLISTNSWLEPLLFLGAIGVAVLINMGTNIFFGRVSFLTNSVSPLLQLAVSLDYAIFLLHRFTDNLKESGAKPEEAMKQAIIASITAISASALTTLFGFIALVFMEFKIGADLGLILAKGIISSFISVVVFLPALTLCVHKALERTRHRPLLPDFGNVYKIISKTAAPAVVIVLIIIVPGFLGQQRTSFVYGAGSASSGTYLERDKNAIEGIFGKNNIAALLVPAGDIVKERDMCLELEDLDNVNSVMSYARTVGTAIPSGFLGDDITSQFYSDKYARIIIYTDTPGEGDIAFDAVERIQATAGKYYDEYYLAGQSSSLNDMKNIVVTDNLRVNSIAIVTIFLVIMMSFRSLVLPCILLVTIETGIWVNLSIPYFTNTPINFIGFLVISTVQLGATVDYAILLTDHYRVNRKLMDKKAALQKSLGSAVKSILISGFTLSLAGFTLYLTSTNTSIRDIGFLLGRGTLLSMLMVLCFLPPVLSAFDTLIAKGTWGAGFYFDERNGHNNEAG